MKKMYLSMLLLIGFQIIANAQCVNSVTVSVNTIAELNTAIDNMELNSVDTETTIVIADGIYNSSTSSSLNRDIDVEGGCPCTIEAENADPSKHELFLKGDVSWRLNNSNNLTIDGIIFRRTVDVGNIPLISLNTLSHSNVLINNVLMEYESTTLTDIYPFLKINGGNVLKTGNIIDNCIFQNKYSQGNYVELINTEKLKISSSIFRESDTGLFTGTSSADVKRYIYSTGSNNLQIEGSSFHDKYSHWAYVQLNNGKNNIIHDNTFYETAVDPNAVDPVPNETVITTSGEKDYIKVVDEENLFITDNDFLRKFSLSHMINYSPTASPPEIVGGEISGNDFGPKFQAAPSSMIKLGNCGGGTFGLDAMNILIKDNTFDGYNYQSPINGYYEIISNKSSGNIYENNTFKNCNGNLHIRCGNNVTVRNNEFFGDNTGIKAGITVSGTNHKIYNNYFKDLTYPVLNISGGDLDGNYQRVENLEFAFNTAINCGINIKFNKDVPSNPKDGDGQFTMARNNRIENNIFYNNRSLSNQLFVWMDSDYDASDIVDSFPFSTNSFRNNIFSSNASNTYFIALLQDPIITGDWILPNVTTIITADPQFVDIVNQNYVLASTSSAIDDAHDTSHYDDYISQDILGANRNSIFDIGCYEDQSASRNVTNSIGLFENTKTKLQSYPNPTTDIITVAGVSGESMFVIYNINGVKVKEGTLSNNQQINVEKLSKGMYFLTINNSETIKLIKN